MFTLRIIAGVALILLGIALGLYIGIWWAFIGGIVQIVQQVQSDNIDALTIACGVAKVLFADTLGLLVASPLSRLAAPYCRRTNHDVTGHDMT